MEIMVDTGRGRKIVDPRCQVPANSFFFFFVEHYVKFTGQVYKQLGVIHTTVTQENYVSFVLVDLQDSYMQDFI